MSVNFTVFDFEQSSQSSRASNSVIPFTAIRLHYSSRCILARILSKGLTEVNHEAHTHEGDNELSGARPLQRRSPAHHAYKSSQLDGKVDVMFGGSN